MAEIWVFVECAGEKILRVCQEAVSEAVRHAGRPDARCTALILGHRIPPKVLEDLRRFGVDRVLVCEKESLSGLSPDRLTDCLERILKDQAPDVCLYPFIVAILVEMEGWKAGRRMASSLRFLPEFSSPDSLLKVSGSHPPATRPEHGPPSAISWRGYSTARRKPSWTAPMKSCGWRTRRYPSG